VSVTKYPLEHFYYGQRPRESRPMLLAASPGVSPELVANAVERVSLPPLPDGSAWALVRGNRQLPFLLVQSRQTKVGESIAHYILIPFDVLRAVGGNIRNLVEQFTLKEPAFSDTSQRLDLLEVSPSPQETVEQQIDDMLDLMTVTNNRIEVMENLLGAIVRGVQIVVQEAPAQFEPRIDFISGILALLPPSVRYAVTFATHSTASTNLDVQIRFLNDRLTLPETLIYNWQQSSLSGEAIEDDYSRFVMSQLRLDPSLVIERTRALTPMTGWRMRQGDRLGDALAYGSHRLQVDTALLNNLPVDKDEVAKILREDPTLNDDLRVVYGRHLLTFSMAMDDIQHADPLMELLSANPELQASVFQQMFDALNDKQASTVYKLIAHWLENTTINDNERWVTLAHRAAIAHVDNLSASKSFDALNDFAAHLLQAASPVHLERIIGRLMEKLLPLTPQDATLAENVFLLSVAYMDTQRFKRLLEMKPFVAQLQPQVRQVLEYLNGTETGKPPQGILVNSARSFGETWEALILVRFAELARSIGRFDLLDERVLNGVVKVAASPLMPIHYERLRSISDRPNEGDLSLLGAKAARHLLQIRLAIGDYPDLASQMIQQSSTLYRGDLQTEYIKTVEQVFAETPIPPERAAQAIDEISQSGIKSAPLTMAAIGALQNRPPSPELQRLTDRIADLLTHEPQLLNVIPSTSILSLLKFHVDANDTSNALLTADLISLAAAQHSDNGLHITGQMYKLMAENRATRPAALNILRTYLWQAEDRASRQAVAYFGRELGSSVRNALEATYLVKQLLNGRNLTEYAQMVQRTVAFLQDAAASYNERNTPTLDDLTLRLNAMRDSFMREERRVFTRALLSYMKGIVSLYQHQKSTRSADVTSLLNAEADPTSGVDLLRVVGGYFADGKRADLRLRSSLPNPLGERTRKFLRDEIMSGNEVISGILRAVPSDVKLEVKADQIRDAVSSLTTDLSADAQREVARILGGDLQRLAALIQLIGEKGDPKAVEEGGLGDRIDEGRHRPRSALEYMRFLYGYHLTKG
jgi:hypothetical protein